MRHKTISRRLGVPTDHRISMLRNLSASVVEHGRIKTTTSRAKSLRPFLEPLVTKLKDASVHNIREATSTLANRKVALSIAHKISPVMKDRKGGYLRILKLSTPRTGDCADMSLIEWVEKSLVPFYQESSEKKAPAKKAKAAKKKPSTKKKKSS